MKKLIFLLVFLPFVAVSQTNLNQSAEEFVKSYFKMFEDKKWDEILRSCSEDGQMIWPNHTITSLPVTMKSIVERSKIDMNSDKIDVKWILSDAIGPSSAMVTVSYLETTDRSGNIRVTDNLDVYLLELKEGAWKIKKLIPQDNYPLIYSEHIDKKYQTDRMGPLNRFDGALVQNEFIYMFELESSKEKGIKPVELGKMIGERDAKIDHEAGEFAGLASAFVWGIQTLSTYTEVIERNDNALKLKFVPFRIPKTWGSDATNEDLRMMLESCWNESANSMGGNCSLEESGKFWVLTLNKK